MKALPALTAAAALTFTLSACGVSTITDTPDNGTTASTSEAATAKKPNTAKVGSVITLKGSNSDLKIAVKLVKVLTDPPGADEFTKPSAGKRFYAVDLLLKNVGKVAYDDSPSNGAYVISDGGEQYGATIGEVKGGTAINATAIGTGDSRRGLIVFEVPKKAKIVKFQLGLDSGFADQRGEWTIK